MRSRVAEKLPNAYQDRFTGNIRLFGPKGTRPSYERNLKVKRLPVKFTCNRLAWGRFRVGQCRVVRWFWKG
jgi:hypothetical protein